MPGAETVVAELPAHVVALLTPPERPAPTVSFRAVWSDDESKIRRGRAYVAKVPPAPLGTRNDTAFRVAAWLTRDLDLGEGDARALLHEMNGSWPSPLGTREIELALQSAIKNGKRSFGCADAASFSGASHRRFAAAPMVRTGRWDP